MVFQEVIIKEPCGVDSDAEELACLEVSTVLSSDTVCLPGVIAQFSDTALHHCYFSSENKFHFNS